MAQTKAVTKPIPPHKILREVYRHYLEFRDLVSNHGTHEIDEVGDKSGHYKEVVVDDPDDP